MPRRAGFHCQAEVVTAQLRPSRGRPRPEWVVRAACRRPGVDLADFYPEPDQDPKAATQRAKNVCAPCPCRTECLAWSYLASDGWGIWGGLTPSERRNRVARGCAA